MASHITVPWVVSTPLMRPFSVRMPVTPVRSKIFAPRGLAAFTNAAQTSEGLTRPSSGDQTAPSTSSAFIRGQRSLASPAEMDVASIP